MQHHALIYLFLINASHHALIYLFLINASHHALSHTRNPPFRQKSWS
jgi:hypothetical protein